MDVSLAKIDITPEIRGISMLGYGNPKNIIKGVETPINVRSCCFRDTDGFHYFMLNYELCFITDSLYTPLREYLESKLGSDNFIIHLSAQHTHSAPSGYDHYALYNMPTPGFVESVHSKIISSSKEAIDLCIKELSPGEIFYHEGDMPLNEDVSFNRSMLAYLNNPEVQKENLPRTKRAAVNKKMQLLSIKKDGKLIGSLNWFAVHSTNIPNTNFYISPDNKGYGALKLEDEFKEENHIALFNQGNAGDVSPNFIAKGRSGALRGKYANPYDSAKYNGSLQAQLCLDLLKSDQVVTFDGKFKSLSCYRDMSNIKPYPEYLPEGSSKNARTTEPCHGVAFIQGTKDGPGINQYLGFIVKLAASLVKAFHIGTSYFLPKGQREKVWGLYRNQYPKSIFVNAGDKNILGASNLAKLPIPNFVDPLVKTLKEFFAKGAMQELSWVQKVLPTQLTLIGDFVIVSFPGEVTTIAGRRIKKQIEKLLGEDKKIIISPYSNGFCGYITTPEEYEMQCYEGGHTLFGKWTLPAFQSVLHDLILAIKENRDAPSELAPQFSQNEISLRSYQS